MRRLPWRYLFFSLWCNNWFTHWYIFFSLYSFSFCSCKQMTAQRILFVCTDLSEGTVWLTGNIIKNQTHLGATSPDNFLCHCSRFIVLNRWWWGAIIWSMSTVQRAVCIISWLNGSLHIQTVQKSSCELKHGWNLRGAKKTLRECFSYWKRMAPLLYLHLTGT